MEIKKFISSEENVTKYVFTKDDCVYEAVLYKYNSYLERTVICCSTQSGCRVGCKFCGTGGNFIRNLDFMEITEQIYHIIKDIEMQEQTKNIKKFQIMFMSMGEPMHNWDNVELAIKILNKIYPNAQLLLSTIGVNDNEVLSRIIKISKEIENVGLQFSIHESTDTKRNRLIPFKNKLGLREIRDFGMFWYQQTKRNPYINYCVTGKNNTTEDTENLKNLFSPFIFNLTFSVVCSSNENMKEAGFRNLEDIRKFEQSFIEGGYHTRIFDPAGQDDIGGGCGQLWYTQKWIKEFKKEVE